MSEARVVARISFRGIDADEVLDPGPALDDAVGVLENLQPTAFSFVQQISDPAVSLEISADFGERGAGKADAFRTALVRAEGEAGFRATFLPERSDLAGWGLAEWRLGDLALPSGLGFGLPTPHFGVEAEIARLLRLTTKGFGGAIHGVRRHPSPDVARALVRPLAQAEGAGGGAAAQVAAAIRSAMDIAAQDGWKVREGVCLGSQANEASASLVENALAGHGDALYPFLPKDMRHVDWRPLDSFDEPFKGPGLFRTPSLQKQLAPMRDGRYMARALRGMLANARAHSERLSSPPGRAHAPPAAPNGGYAFLSYARLDADPALSMMRRLQDRGVRVWCDTEMGAEQTWDEHLEQRVRGCASLIACVSPAYENSRYCRREIKFADLLKKPIVPVSVDGSYLWGEGLAMRFQEYQVLNGRDPGWTDAAFKTLRRLAPGCVGRPS
jgi:hypothetical protein